MGINPNGNSHSQLGTRTVLPIGNPDHNPSSPQPLVPLLASSTSPAQDVISALPPSLDIRYSTKLNQITSLSGIDIIQIAAGENTSFFRTRGEGRVLGLGANAFGQIGLGAMSSVDIVPVPTEIVLAKAYPGGTSLKCLNIAAGKWFAAALAGLFKLTCIVMPLLQALITRTSLWSVLQLVNHI